MRVVLLTALLLGCFTSFVGCGTAPVAPQAETTSGTVETSSWHNGNVRFTCRLACAFAFGTNRDRLQQLHEAQLWTALSSEVLRLQFDQDLSYYYLGRAAEGLGHLDAARSYYVRSMHAQYHCDDAFDLCNGLNLRKALSDRLASIQEAQSVRLTVPPVTVAVAPPHVEKGQVTPLSGLGTASSVGASIASRQESPAASPTAHDKRTPAQRYQGAYLGAWLLCTLNQKLIYKYAEAEQRGIRIEADRKRPGNMDDCIKGGLVNMKAEYLGMQKLISGVAAKRALEEHYVGAIMHVKQTHPRPRETEDTYTERMNEMKRKTDELWVRFEITQP
jgi:hypothetical protein